ncbi:MAG: hypothetical protein GM48_4230 [actinobacterium acIB-AMD-7]|nr:MAG: hypothetical protein GM48_4230 [actinobacterium acIB-AMD-7]
MVKIRFLESMALESVITLINECAKAAVNVEDLSIEHSPGQETGLITLALSENDCKKLADHMNKQGFKVHPAKNR